MSAVDAGAAASDPGLGVNGRRGWYLIVYAIASAFIGLSYVKFPKSPGREATFAFLPDWLPIESLCAIWWLAASLAVISAFQRPPRRDFLGFGVIAGVLSLWGGFFMIAWLNGSSASGWLEAVKYWAFTAAIMIIAFWPNPPRKVEPPRLMDPQGPA